ncbi:hypothetical protein KKF91_17460 [Myxococcota bacterium]|nr:hypothetical protein [Myxococcota bacterium]MBU1432329.1 hypothetical protein [Myxococcota bacterium]MBU1897072.1 hypothetical protein [Myxococcota bacterium]
MAASAGGRAWAWLEYQLRRAWPFGLRTPQQRRYFYPGCALTSAAPELTVQVWRHLKAQDPDIGLWLDCCAYPLRMQRPKDPTPEALRAEAVIGRRVARAGVEEIITACGNCAHQFERLGVPTRSLYDLLAQDQAWAGALAGEAPVIVHHPCPARVDLEQAAAFESLAALAALPRAPQKKHPLSCCLNKDATAQRRRAALKDQPLVTYCGHCTRSFQRDIPTRHILQLLFKEDRRLIPAGRGRWFLNYLRARLMARRG